MASVAPLALPPIQEALVDIQTAVTSSPDDSQLEGIADGLKARFPVKEARRKFEATLGPGHAVTTDLGSDGLRLRDLGQSRVVQLRPNGYTFSLLKGYTNGTALLAEALDIWEDYVRAVAPHAVVRIALRYVNRLLLPFGHGDPLERFLTAPVTMPPETPQEVAEFLTRSALVINEESQIYGIVTQHLKGPTQGSTPYILDVDVYRTGQFGTDRASLEKVLDALRLEKNRLFFGFLTEDALKGYR